MVEAGLTPDAGALAATSGAARAWARRPRTLEPGDWADFLVLRDDPRTDIRNTHSLESVWIAGNRVPERRSNATR